MSFRASLAVLMGLLCGGAPAFASDANTDRIAMLKRKIRRIAVEATAKLEFQNQFDPATRAALNPLVQELVSIAPKLTPKQQLEASLGSWQSLWSDLPFSRAVANQIYQVVFPNGFYFNISKYKEKDAIYTSFLRGEYRLRDTDFEIRFTKAVRAKNFPKHGTDLYRLAMLAELGVYDGMIDEGNAASLNRPGTLTTLYIDNDLRVVGGELKENGVVDSLFVLERRTTIR